MDEGYRVKSCGRLVHLKEILRREKDRGKTILITTHIMSFVEEMADEIVFLLDGKIYFKGSSEDLRSQTKQSDLEHAIAALMQQNIDTEATDS